MSNTPSGRFSTQSLDGWSEQSFKGNTDYELVRENDVPVLKGHAQNQASILYREESIDLRKTPIINWSWKVDRTFKDIEEKTKMVSIQSGNTYVGQWTEHSRNVAEDCKALVNQDIEQITGYAVMVDGDNANVEAVAWFGQISFTDNVLTE